MACGEAKCSWPGPALFSSMMTRPAVRAVAPAVWKRAWARVPERFCAAVWVGCRTRAAWIESRKPAELRRGCAEKKMSFWEKMAPQTMAASWCLVSIWVAVEG
jgi:hypothetical protein